MVTLTLWVPIAAAVHVLTGVAATPGHSYRIMDGPHRAATLAGAVTGDAVRRSIATNAAGARTAGSAMLPVDVRAFVKRRDECDHLRGEDPATGNVADRLARACRGTDADLARLGRKYSRDAAVTRVLAVYDPKVE